MAVKRPTLADHEQRIAVLEETVPLIRDMHSWLAEAGLDNGTGKKLRLLGEMVEERQDAMSDHEALRRTKEIVRRRLSTSLLGGAWRALGQPRRVAKWVALALASAALWRLGQGVPLDHMPHLLPH
jgi:hypothetical protein